MDFGSIMSAVGTGFSNVAGGLANLGSAWATIKGVQENKRVNDINFQLQKENLAYQKDLQKIMFRREDNAVQRRVADLRKAGLSPTLAAGSAAGAGSVISTSAPQRLSDLQGYLALAQVGTMIAQQQKAQTDADIARQQLKQVKLDTKYYRDRGIAPVEANQDWKQRLINLLYPKLEHWLFGEDTKSGAVKEVVDAMTNTSDWSVPKYLPPYTGSAPSPFPYDVPRAVRYNGEKLNDRQYEILKKAGLYNTWISEGFSNRKVRETLTRYGR